MTLPSRHRNQNSSPGSPRPSLLPLSHGGSPQYWIFTSEQGRNISFLWILNARTVDEATTSNFPNRQLYPLSQSTHQWMKITHYSNIVFECVIIFLIALLSYKIYYDTSTSQQTHRPRVSLMLAHRLQCRPNNKATNGQRLVFSEIRH